jgi:hypothetical protein
MCDAYLNCSLKILLLLLEYTHANAKNTLIVYKEYLVSNNDVFFY